MKLALSVERSNGKGKPIEIRSSALGGLVHVGGRVEKTRMKWAFLDVGIRACPLRVRARRKTRCTTASASQRLVLGVVEPRQFGRLLAIRGRDGARHFYASWCINPEDRGGQGLLPKVVQDRLGHSSIVMTMDTYGHLFPRGDDEAELAAAEKAFLGS
jgi:hypothetical protein